MPPPMPGPPAPPAPPGPPGRPPPGRPRPGPPGPAGRPPRGGGAELGVGCLGHHRRVGAGHARHRRRCRRDAASGHRGRQARLGGRRARLGGRRAVGATTLLRPHALGGSERVVTGPRGARLAGTGAWAWGLRASDRGRLGGGPRSRVAGRCPGAAGRCGAGVAGRAAWAPESRAPPGASPAEVPGRGAGVAPAGAWAGGPWRRGAQRHPRTEAGAGAAGATGADGVTAGCGVRRRSGRAWGARPGSRRGLRCSRRGRRGRARLPSASRMRRTTGASSVEDGPRTYSPFSPSQARRSLLVLPISLAISWTRGFATTLLCGPTSKGRTFSCAESSLGSHRVVMSVSPPSGCRPVGRGTMRPRQRRGPLDIISSPGGSIQPEGQRAGQCAAGSSSTAAPNARRTARRRIARLQAVGVDVGSAPGQARVGCRRRRGRRDGRAEGAGPDRRGLGSRCRCVGESSDPSLRATLPAASPATAQRPDRTRPGRLIHRASSPRSTHHQEDTCRTS